MINKASTYAQLRRLWLHISQRRHIQFKALLLLVVLASISEIVSIGAILPFLGVLTAPQKVFEAPLLAPYIRMMRIQSPDELIFPLTIFFCLAAIVSASIRILLLRFSSRLAFLTGADLGLMIYKKTLYQPYIVHLSRNSSDVISGIINKTGSVIFQTLLPMVNLLGSVVILTSILITLLYINPLIAVITFMGYGTLYAAIIFFTRRSLALNGIIESQESTRVIKYLQEGLGGIRDILINRLQEIYCNFYHNSDLKLRQAQSNNIFIGGSPRFAMEALGLVLLVLLAYFLSKDTAKFGELVPILGLFAFGAQRLLPILQQIYASIVNIRSGKAALSDVLGMLDQPLPIKTHASRVPLNFNSSIELKGVYFAYERGAPYIFKDLNLIIPKGARIGVIGKSGVGKSTLSDLIMGLLSPTTGSLNVDGININEANQEDWQRKIAHVPQNIYLGDFTIAENIAFGTPKDQIDIPKMLICAEQAQIAGMVEGLPQKYDTVVGERGIRLSGGQRQRIAIARALYRDASVLIFDEATSALDGDTEEDVMSSIWGLNSSLTILIIAHRLSSLKNCTQVIEIEVGGSLTQARDI